MKRNRTKLDAIGRCRSGARELEGEEGSRKQWWTQEFGLVLLVAIRSSSRFRRLLSPPTPYFQMILECEIGELLCLSDEAEQNKTD